MQIEFVAVVQEVREGPRLIQYPSTFSFPSTILGILGVVYLVPATWLQQLQPLCGNMTTSREEGHLFSYISVLRNKFLPMPKLLGRKNWVSAMCSFYNGRHILP